MSNSDGGCMCDEEHPVIDGSACRSYGLSFVTELDLADYVRDFLVDSNNVMYMLAGRSKSQTKVYIYDGARWSVLGPANHFSDNDRSWSFSMVMDKSTNRLYVSSMNPSGTNFAVEYFDGSAWVNLGDEGFLLDPPENPKIYDAFFGIALDRNGTLYAHYTYKDAYGSCYVVKYDKDEGAWVRVASGDIGSPRGMLIDSQGKIYVESSEGTHPLVPVVDGAFGEPLWSYSGNERHYFETVRLDSRDRIWYMYYINTPGYPLYLKMYDPQTKENTRMASLSDAFGEPIYSFWGAGMAFDDDDNIFICINLAGYINDDPSEDSDYDYRGSFFTYGDGNLKLEFRKFSAKGLTNCHVDIDGDNTPFVASSVGMWADPYDDGSLADYISTVWMRH